MVCSKIWLDSFLKFCCCFMQNVSTESLFNMINRILDGTVETKNGDVSHVWDWLSFFLKHLKFSPRNSNTISDFRAIFLSRMEFICISTSNFAFYGSNFSQQVAYILRKVVQVLEQRILTHAGNLKHVIFAKHNF